MPSDVSNVNTNVAREGEALPVEDEFDLRLKRMMRYRWFGPIGLGLSVGRDFVTRTTVAMIGAALLAPALVAWTAVAAVYPLASAVLIILGGYVLCWAWVPLTGALIRAEEHILLSALERNDDQGRFIFTAVKFLPFLLSLCVMILAIIAGWLSRSDLLICIGAAAVLQFVALVFYTDHHPITSNFTFIGRLKFPVVPEAEIPAAQEVSEEAEREG